MASSVGVSGEELRLVLVGKTGVGKSATCNMIVGKTKKGERLFETSALANSQTQTCHMEKVESLGRLVTLVDTPGLCDTKRSSADVEKSIGMFAALSVPGPHAILLVLSAAGKFTPEEVQCIKRVIDLFGKKILDHLIIVITKTENWEEEDITPQVFLNGLPQELKDVIPAIVRQHRSIAFSNILKGKDAENQVRRLFEMIDGTVQANGGSYYRDEYWNQAEKEVQERMEKMKEDEKAMLREIYTKNYELFLRILQNSTDVLNVLKQMLAQRLFEKETKVCTVL